MINGNYFLLNVALLTVGTYMIRASFILLSGKFLITPKIRELFTYIPAAIFPALIIPSAFYHQGVVAWLGDKERFLTLLLMIGASFLYRSTLFTISLGLALLYFFIAISN